MTTTEACPKCARKDSQHYEGVCLECGGMMFFMWWGIDGMDEPREEVIKRRIERVIARMEGQDE